MICDHGTHVAGIAAGDGTGVALANAQVSGVAPAATIIAIQVFHRRETTCGTNPAPCVVAAVSDQIAGLDRVLDLSDDFTIVAANMSLGGGDFTAACDADQAPRKAAIDALIVENIATTIASGNNNIDNAVGAPACISTAVAVGATDNADNVTRNRGPLLDLFAPGSGITSAGANTGFVSKGGTSMAAPHVAGAWAILRQVYPGASVADILATLQTTGVPITYNSGGGTNNVTTPRIDLLAAVQASADPPTLTVDDDSVTVDEGQTATNTGTFTSGALPVTLTASVGSVTDEGGGVWSWSFDTVDGPAQSQTVTITATDSLGQDGEVTFELVVDNVAPSVHIDPAQVTTIAEGDGLLVTAHFTDPGTLDFHTVTVICHSVGGPQMAPGTIDITSTSPVTADRPRPSCGITRSAWRRGANVPGPSHRRRRVVK